MTRPASYPSPTCAPRQTNIQNNNKGTRDPRLPTRRRTAPRDARAFNFELKSPPFCTMDASNPLRCSCGPSCDARAATAAAAVRTARAQQAARTTGAQQQQQQHGTCESNTNAGFANASEGTVFFAYTAAPPYELKDPRSIDAPSPEAGAKEYMFPYRPKSERLRERATNVSPQPQLQHQAAAHTTNALAAAAARRSLGRPQRAPPPPPPPRQRARTHTSALSSARSTAQYSAPCPAPRSCPPCTASTAPSPRSSQARPCHPQAGPQTGPPPRPAARPAPAPARQPASAPPPPAHRVRPHARPIACTATCAPAHQSRAITADGGRSDGQRSGGRGPQWRTRETQRGPACRPRPQRAPRSRHAPYGPLHPPPARRGASCPPERCAAGANSGFLEISAGQAPEFVNNGTEHDACVRAQPG